MAAPSSSATTNVMLAIYEKKTVAIDLYRPVRNYIVIYYSEREAQRLEDDLETLRQLRADLERGTSDSLPARRDLLQKYFRALCAVESRFPISPDKDHINTVTFTWYDAFKNKQKAVQQNIHLEKAAVLFNLGAVHSQMGLSLDRSTADGRRQASHSFIAAAGVFSFLKDNVAMKASMGNSTTVDVSVECAGMLERLMLAQAQECVFENTIAKGSTPGVCAKISRQVGIFYEEALSALTSAPLNQHFDKAWLTHIQIKAALFYAEACYRYSLELHEKEEIAEEIARLKCGISALSDTKKSSPKGAVQQLIEAANKLEMTLNNNLDRAVKENNRVYLMRVPPASSLTALPAFSMVKPMPMNEVLDASKEKMFASLVPDSSAKALSRYTEMVDNVIRTQAEKLQQGSELARVRLKEMDLPDSILSLEGNSTLPKVLKEDVEAVQICGGPAALEGDLEQLKDLRRVNQEMLVQTEELLEKEAMEDAQFRSQFGTRWTRPQSSTLTKNLQDRLNRFAANLKQASESDARIERSVRDHAVLMSILDRRPIESTLPTLARPMMSLDASEDAIVGALKQSLRQLESLGAQRAGLEDMLKEMKRKDDILPKLMTSTGSHEDLFRKEIGKYDHICQDIAQNIEAQEQLLLQIQAQNDEFAAIFNLEDYKVTCEKIYRQIEAAIAKYREIKDNVNEGLKFYVTLQDAITNVKQQCNDFVNTRSMQCREMIDDVQRKISGLSFQDPKTSGSYNYPSVGQPNSQPTGPTNPSNPPPTQSPVYQPPQPQPTIPGYGHPPQQSTIPGYGNPPKQPTVPGYGNPPQQPTVPGYDNPSQQPSVPRYGNPPQQSTVPEYGNPPQQPTVPGYGNPHQQPTVPGYGNHPQQPTVPGYGNPPQQPSVLGYGNPSQQPSVLGYGNPSQQPTVPGYGNPSQQPTVPGYAHPPPPYATSQQPPPPYHLPAQSTPYPHPQYQQQPLPSHEYAQPAYPGWRGHYYNAPPQQPAGSMPRPPYTVRPYPPNQNGYYRQ